MLLEKPFNRGRDRQRDFGGESTATDEQKQEVKRGRCGSEPPPDGSEAETVELSPLGREAGRTQHAEKIILSKICMTVPRSFPRALLLQLVPPQLRRLIAVSPPDSATYTRKYTKNAAETKWLGSPRKRRSCSALAPCPPH